jgi:hypothetical protein
MLNRVINDKEASELKKKIERDAIVDGVAATINQLSGSKLGWALKCAVKAMDAWYADGDIEHAKKLKAIVASVR